MGDPESVLSILWSSDPATQRAIGLVLGAAFLAAVAIYGPLLVSAVRLLMLERRVRAQLQDRDDASREGDPLRELMLDSPVREAFQEFERRWATSQLAERQDRAPIRLSDIFDDRPLLPFGPRRSLLPVLPGLFVGLGVLAALTGLIPSLASFSTPEGGEGSQSVWMATQLGLALRASAWGFLCAIGATLAGRLLEGSFNARSTGLDALVEQTYGSVSPGELAEITRQTQQSNLDTLGKELTQFAHEFNERLDRGLQRIEQSTARSASLVSQEQRGALHTVVQELSVSVRQGVENHLSELRGALQRAIDHQTSVTGGLAENFERMAENSQTQDRVARTLVEAASSVEQAAQIMSGTAVEMNPVLEHLRSTSRSLSETADRIGDTQLVMARTAEGVRASLEHAASGVDDQRQFIERSLSEIRRALEGLGDGLGDSLQRSLRAVDDVLGSTVGQLRETLAESNETIERLAGPIRAAEGSTHETHVALDRVRTEVEALGQWMTMAIKPIRTGLVDVDGRAEEMTRAITDFTGHARQIDKTMESLREEIHGESRHLQDAGNELGRRLSQATDAIGLLESTTSDVARRARPESNGSPRARTWSPAPAAADASANLGKSTDEGLSRTPPNSMDPDDAAWAPPEMPASDHHDTYEDPADSDTANPPVAASSNSESPSSGFRMGAPRAQGPDPYARLDAKAASTSNLRHFPTPDRELGDNLKLSDLLRPSTDNTENADNADETSDATRRSDADSTEKPSRSDDTE